MRFTACPVARDTKGSIDEILKCKIRRQRERERKREEVYVVIRLIFYLASYKVLTLNTGGLDGRKNCNTIRSKIIYE